MAFSHAIQPHNKDGASAPEYHLASAPVIPIPARTLASGAET